MAQEVRSFPCTIAAGTPAATPVTITNAFPVRLVRQIEILFPPGCSGLVGVGIVNAGQQVIPANTTQWLIADNQRIVWPLSGFIESGSWALRGYNTGVFPHTIYVTYLLDLPPVPGAAPLMPLGAGQLSGVA